MPSANPPILQISLAVLCLWAGFSALTAAWRGQWPTGDEYWHFAWSERLVATGDTERQSAPNFISAMPVTVLNVWSRNAADQLGVRDARVRTFFSRLPTVLWFGLLLVAVYGFGRRFFGKPAAVLATAMVAVDQNLIAHGSIVSVDVAFAVAALGSTWATVAYWQRPSWRRALVAGAALGVAFACKYTAVLSAVILAAAVLATLVQRRKPWRVLVDYLVVGLGAALVISAAFGFKGLFVPFSSLALASPPGQKVASLLPFTPLPVPFITGLDAVLHYERAMAWNSVIAGHYFENGVWYYFPLLWWLKTPLGVLALEIGAVAVVLARPRLYRREAVLAWLGVAFAVFMGYFSFLFRTQVGYRYTLMCVPFGALMAAMVLAKAVPPRRLAWLSAVLIALAAVEGTTYFGNPLAFSNLWIWPKQEAFRWLADSNIDWFQNYNANRKIMADVWPTAVFEPPHVVPGVNVFTVNRLAGVWRNFAQHRWLRETLQPQAHIGHTYVVFSVSEAEFQTFVHDERSFVPPAGAEAFCPPDPLYAVLSQPRPAALVTPSGAPYPRLCAQVQSDALVELTLTAGNAEIGWPTAGGDCHGEAVSAGQSLWFALKAGTYPFCVRGRDAPGVTNLTVTAHSGTVLVPVVVTRGP